MELAGTDSARWRSIFTESYQYIEGCDIIQSYVRRDDPTITLEYATYGSPSFSVAQFPVLTVVDTQVGNKQCIADTQKQWDTIITAVGDPYAGPLLDPSREDLLKLKYTGTKKKKDGSPPSLMRGQYAFLSVGGGFEEMLNDSEYVKGMGIVPINRVYEEERPVIVQPWKLPAASCHDLDIDVAFCMTSEKPIDEIKMRVLQWRGVNDQRVLIVDTQTESSIIIIDLEKVRVIKYYMASAKRGETQHHLLFTYSDDGGKDRTVILMTEASEEQFALLKRCCYGAKVTVQQKCDLEQVPFFMQKRKEIESIHNPPAPLDLPPRPTSDKRRGDLSTSVSHSSSPEPSVLPEKAKSAATIFYDMVGKQETPLPVSTGDSVIRKRGDDEFDGPWRILRFRNKQEARLTEEADDSLSNNQRGKAIARAGFDDDSWRAMLCTEVELAFPKESRANRWAPISSLFPIVQVRNINNGEVVASGITVQNMNQFKVLKGRMNGSHRDANTHATEPETLLCAEISPSVFLASVSVLPYHHTKCQEYEIQKIKGKRLRVFAPNHPEVKKWKLFTDTDDTWIQRLEKHHPEVMADRVVVAEYLVQWAGWPIEDDEWTIGQNNIEDQSFIDEYDQTLDPYSDNAHDAPIDLEQHVKQEETPKPKRGVARKSRTRKHQHPSDDDAESPSAKRSRATESDDN